MRFLAKVLLKFSVCKAETASRQCVLQRGMSIFYYKILHFYLESIYKHVNTHVTLDDINYFKIIGYYLRKITRMISLLFSLRLMGAKTHITIVLEITTYVYFHWIL